MATAGEDRNSASEDGCPVERALIANEMMLYSEQDKILELQLKHLNESWYHGVVGRREARHILLDFNGGNCSFLVRTSQRLEGKFSISVLYEDRVYHIMIRSTPHHRTRVFYNVGLDGPFHTSLYDLVEDCRQTARITNKLFTIKLERVAPKLHTDCSWLDRETLRTHREAEECFSGEGRDGAFFVYQTDPTTDSYSISYRAGDRVQHVQILPTVVMRVRGYTFGTVFSPVMYKIVHYYMENPIQGSTILKYPMKNVNPVAPVCGMAMTSSTSPHLKFPTGSLVTKVRPHETDPQRSIGEYNGKAGSFLTSCLRILSRNEVDYLNTLTPHNAPYPKWGDGLITFLKSQRTSSDSFKFNAQSNKFQVDFKSDDKQIILSSSKQKCKLQCQSEKDFSVWQDFLTFPSTNTSTNDKQKCSIA
ncbi:uncharacterized protein LOC135338483 isoform X2 [Halichondria panicea]|uniref:uncharacterized protein LOC135338483 isoform X2 n=1 Tax=Halichondria panicea TaxID=6063 RepID=UPI00312B48F0